MSVTSSSSRRPFGKPARSPARTPSRLPLARRRRRCDAGVQADQVGLGRAGEVEVDRPADGTQVDAREQDRGEIVAARRGRVVEHGVEAVLEPGHLGGQVAVEEVRVVGGVGPVPAVLLAERDHDLVDERVREPRDLHEVAGRPRRAVSVEHLHALPAGGRVDADHGVRVVRPGRQRAILRQLRDRHLERDRVRVVAADAIDALLRWQRERVRRVERPQAGEVEDRAEVDEERVVDLAGIDLPAARQAPDGGAHQRAVVRSRAGADADRRRRQVLRQHRHPRLTADDAAATPGLDARDAVELRPVPVGVRERVDRAGVVEERVRVPRLGAEAELVADVLVAVAGVVDLDLVEDVVAEAVEVRTAGGLLERDVVRENRDRIRPVRAHERVDVGVVGDRILGDQRRLSVARSGAGIGAGTDERRCHAASAATETAPAARIFDFIFPTPLS